MTEKDLTAGRTARGAAATAARRRANILLIEGGGCFANKKKKSDRYFTISLYNHTLQQEIQCDISTSRFGESPGSRGSLLALLFRRPPRSSLTWSSRIQIWAWMHLSFFGTWYELGQKRDMLRCATTVPLPIQWALKRAAIENRTIGKRNNEWKYATENACYGFFGIQLT